VFPNAHIMKTDLTHAEMVKYLTNSFLATKVSFANEMYQICEGLGVDYDKVIEYATYDKRLGDSHWNVPGPDGDFGYGGHCFPKDVKALMVVAEDMDIIPLMLAATDVKNNEVRKNRDWEQMKGRAVI
jgi:UDP-glucose 6-dehydrogenase